MDSTGEARQALAPKGMAGMVRTAQVRRVKARLGKAGLADIFPGPGTGHAPSGVSRHEQVRWQLVLLRKILIGLSGAGI